MDHWSKPWTPRTQKFGDQGLLDHHNQIGVFSNWFFHKKGFLHLWIPYWLIDQVLLPNACTSNLRLKSNKDQVQIIMNLSIPLGSRWVGLFADLVVLDDLLGFGRSFNSLTSLYYQLFVILRIEWSNRRYHWTFLEQFEAVFDFRTTRFSFEKNDWQYAFDLKVI